MDELSESDTSVIYFLHLFLFLARSSLTRPGLTPTGPFHVPFFPALMTFHVLVDFTVGHRASSTSTTIAGDSRRLHWLFLEHKILKDQPELALRLGF